MRAAVGRYYKTEAAITNTIGCVLLRGIFFTGSTEVVEAPSDFSKHIVRYKGYELTDSPEIEQRLDLMFQRADIRFSDSYGSTDLGSTRGLPALTLPRLGQQAFKGLVLTSYFRRCAITGTRIEPTLEAAHIRPVALEGHHRVDNGLLLRSDVHTLFDRGYLGLDDGYRLQVSRRLRADWGNGQEFYDRAGSVIAVPAAPRDRPAKEAVVWHMDSIFLS